MSSSDKHINTDMSAEAKRAFDEAAAGLFEIFKNKPRRPQEHFISYDLIRRADGTVTFVQNEVDLLVRRAFAAVFRKVSDK